MMNSNNVVIRLEKKEEQRTVEEMVRESFWNVYRPGAMEHYVLHLLRDDAAFVPELNLVMELDGRVIGQVVSVKSEVMFDGGGKLPMLTMGPICIANDLKRQGYGKLLLDYWLEQATALGFGAVCFEGNIEFYGKSGLVRAGEFGLRYHGMPQGEEADFFLCKELQPGYLADVRGEYAPPEVYMVADEDVDEFDRSFAPMEKLRLPGQLF